MITQVVIITGASSGIGRALAYEYARKQWKVVMAARNYTALKEMEANIGSENCLPVPCDVTLESDCKRMVDAAIERFGRIDVLINNAGISMRAAFLECTTETLHRVMDVNFWGTVYCTKYALPHLLNVRGSVVGVLSIACYLGLPGRTAYSASKFAIRGFLDTLRVEYRKHGLHVLVAAPGFVASDIREHALLADGSPQGQSPRNEGRMMTAETCARYIFRAVKHRKRTLVLSFMHGKLAVFLSKWWPSLVDFCNYRTMKKEPDSPFK
jgi:NAD(P)-dependent dehydrogenase (short-subunit alcohol dehydrogenase family)